MMFVVLVDLIELRTAERWVSGYACGRLMWKACLDCGQGHSLTEILDGSSKYLCKRCSASDWATVSPVADLTSLWWTVL